MRIFLKLVFLAISHKLHYLDPQSVLNTDRILDVLQRLTCVGAFYLQWFLSDANFFEILDHFHGNVEKIGVKRQPKSNIFVLALVLTPNANFC